MLRLSNGRIQAIQDFGLDRVFVEAAYQGGVDADGVEGISQVVDELMKVRIHTFPFARSYANLSI